jgi:hypothetical protein
MTTQGSLRGAVPAVGLIGCLATAPAAFGAEAVMTPSELQSLFSNVTISHVSPRSGDAVRLIFQSNGTLDGRAGNRSDRGKWWVSRNGRLCFQFPKLEQGERHCHYLVRKGNRLVRLNRDKAAKAGEDWIVEN